MFSDGTTHGASAGLTLCCIFWVLADKTASLNGGVTQLEFRLVIALSTSVRDRTCQASTKKCHLA